MATYTDEFANPENQTTEYYTKVLSKDGLALKFIKPEYVTQELCYTAFQNNRAAIEFIPYKFQTGDMVDNLFYHEIFDKMVFVDPSLHTHEKWARAIFNRGAFSCIQYMAIQYEDLCIRSLNARIDNFRYIRPEFRTEKVLRVAVGLCPSLLEQIKDQQTESMCIEAIKRDWSAIRFVVTQTKDICVELCKSNHNAFNYVQLPFRYDPEICLLFVKRNPYNLRHVPHFVQTVEMGILSINSNIKNIKYVAKHLRTEVILKCVDYNVKLLKYLTTQEQTYELCLRIVKINPQALCYLTNPQVELFIEAVKSHLNGLHYVKTVLSNHPDPKLLRLLELEAIKHFSEAIQFVDVQTMQLITLALTAKPTAIMYVKYDSVDYDATPLNPDDLFTQYCKGVVSEEMISSEVKKGLQEVLQTLSTDPIQLDGEPGNFTVNNNQFVFVKSFDDMNIVGKYYILQDGDEYKVYKYVPTEPGWFSFTPKVTCELVVSYTFLI
jgi:hypothetical protein